MNSTFQRALDRVRAINPVPWVIIFYIVGLLGLFFPFSRPLFIRLVPFTLLASTLLVLIYHGPAARGFWWKAGLIFLAGLLVEMIGVNTGVVFGEYHYGATLGLKLFGTPLIIGLNWFMLIYAVSVLVSGFTDDLYFRAVLASVAMVAYDFVLEPAAIRLDMWSWDMVAVPLQNYIAWLLVSFVLSLFAARSGLINKDNNVARALFFIQFLFFLALDLAISFGKLWEY
ncbi:MAG: carotenoid biosynthesis protein [Bacteroidota bacterium]